MRRPGTTATQLRATFDKCLARAMRGQSFPIDCGLDDETVRTLREIARSYPHTSTARVALAKTMFQRQLDRHQSLEIGVTRNGTPNVREGSR